MALARAQVDRVARFVAGTLLVMPALLAFGLTLWLPALRTLALSLQAAPTGRPGQFAGLANYRQLAADPAFASALARSLLVAAVRVAALAVPMGLVALCGRGLPAASRWMRLAFGAAAALSAPVALALLWRLAGREVPGLGALDLSERALALRSYLGLEAFYFLGLGGALAATALLMARTPRARRALALLAAIVAVASALNSITLPFTATGGRPAGATLTLPLYAFRTAFQQLRLGQAAAQASLLLVASVGLGLAFGLASERWGLRLVPAGREEAPGPADWGAQERAPGAKGEGRSMPGPPAKGSHALRRVALLSGRVAIALYVAPFALAYLWSMGHAFYPVGQPLSGAAEVLAPGLSLANGALAPLLATLCAGLPVAYGAALSLSLLRPFGRRGSRAVYLLLVAGGFVPPVAVGLGLYDGVRAAGLYNSPVAAALPFVASAPALYLFKLYFDGQAPLLAKACRAGQPALTAFFQLALGPSLRVAALAGAVTILTGAQSLVWPLVVLAQRDFLPLSLRLAVLQGALAAQQGALGAGCWLLLTAWGAATLVAWLLLEALALGRFEVEAAHFWRRPGPGVE